MWVTHPFDLHQNKQLDNKPEYYECSSLLHNPKLIFPTLTYGYLLDKGLYLTEQSEKLCKFRYKEIEITMNDKKRLDIQINKEFVFKGTVSTVEEFETLLKQLGIKFN